MLEDHCLSELNLTMFLILPAFRKESNKSGRLTITNKRLQESFDGDLRSPCRSALAKKVSVIGSSVKRREMLPLRGLICLKAENGAEVY